MLSCFSDALCKCAAKVQHFFDMTKCFVCFLHFVFYIITEFVIINYSFSIKDYSVG